MKFKVTGFSVNRETGKRVSEPRDDIVDTETDGRFSGVRTILEVKRVYEELFPDDVLRLEDNGTYTKLTGIQAGGFILSDSEVVSVDPETIHLRLA